MTDREAIDVLFNEWKCIDRNDGIHCDRKCESCDLVMDVWIIREAFNMAISALQAQEAKAQLSAEGTTSDLISRQKAIEAVEILLEQTEEDADVKTWNNAIRGAINSIKHHVSSAQPEKRTEERTETHACDCISRQAAIDALWEIRQKEISDGRRFHDYCSLSTAVDVIKDLPSAQPEIIHCRDCRYSTDFYQDGCCYCKRPSKEMRYIEEGYGFYCAGAERRTDDANDIT